MSASDKATITTTTTVMATVHLEGYEPIADLKKKSEWNGMWELVRPNGAKIIVMVEGSPFSELFGNAFGSGDKPRDVRVVGATPGLLVPIDKTEAV
jgi:hypothetical protein